ncbi:uncharacterized protein LOC117804322 [Ailuropoda melanoleuca]|uniref:uncharacterized protein LOC117804322 n=1 Tax=Ailuropoda melanoleuca TaxID=9646 RepID=UPI00149425D7|nr:uncharacterized protein LOC117804322 [Ailuropoda melanoleuca]
MQHVILKLEEDLWHCNTFCVKLKLHNPKRYIGSNSNNKKEEEVLQLVDEVVLGVVDEVRAKTGTKDLITIMIKDMEITIVPMVVIKTIVAMAAMIILGITMGTMDMDRDMQTTVANRALMARHLEGVAITKTITSHTKGGRWRKQRELHCRPCVTLTTSISGGRTLRAERKAYTRKRCPVEESAKVNPSCRTTLKIGLLLI